MDYDAKWTKLIRTDLARMQSGSIEYAKLCKTPMRGHEGVVKHG